MSKFDHAYFALGLLGGVGSRGIAREISPKKYLWHPLYGT